MDMRDTVVLGLDTYSKMLVEKKMLEEKIKRYESMFSIGKDWRERPVIKLDTVRLFEPMYKLVEESEFKNTHRLPEPEYYDMSVRLDEIVQEEKTDET